MADEDTVLEEAMDNLKEAGQRIRATQSLMRSEGMTGRESSWPPYAPPYSARHDRSSIPRGSGPQGSLTNRRGRHTIWLLTPRQDDHLYVLRGLQRRKRDWAAERRRDLYDQPQCGEEQGATHTPGPYRVDDVQSSHDQGMCADHLRYARV